MYKSTIRIMSQVRFAYSALHQKILYWTLRREHVGTLPSTSTYCNGSTLYSIGLATGYGPKPYATPGHPDALVDRFPQTYRNDPSIHTVMSYMPRVRPDNLADIAEAIHDMYSIYQDF